MKGFVTNQAGAKIYKDISKHPELVMPILSKTSEKGKVYEVLSVGKYGNKPLVTVKEGSKAIAYLLPNELSGWAANLMLQSAQGIKLTPAEIEFGILNDRPYAEIL